LKSVYSDHYAAFLKLIIAARKKAGLTQQELAEQLSKPQSYVSKYERGERRLDVVEFLQLSHLLNIDPCNIIREIDLKLPKP
jgi:transcriptional regulator with XRE-family HTH domain